MRITNNMVSGNFLKNLNTNLVSLTDYQRQISTGKKLNSLSDDPVKLISSMSCRVRLSKIEQNDSALDSALTWLDQTDTSLSELNDVVKSAYETAIQASSDYLDQDDKTAMAAYVTQLRDQVLTLANSQSSDKYIFGGYNVNKQPFTADSAGNIFYNGLDLTDTTNPALATAASQSIESVIGAGINMKISVTGPELLGTGEDNIYTVLNDFANALNSDAGSEELSQYITKLQDSQSLVLSTQSRVGGMVNRLEMLQSRYSDEKLNFTEQKSKIEDVDIAEAYINYNTAQTVYNAALQVGTEIIQRTVLDYMK